MRGDTDDGDIEFVFCGKIVPASKLFGTDFGECISLDRGVYFIQLPIEFTLQFGQTLFVSDNSYIWFTRIFIIRLIDSFGMLHSIAIKLFQFK